MNETQFPGPGSTALFVILIGFIAAAFVAAHVFTGSGDRNKLIRQGVLLVAAWLALTGLIPFARELGYLSLRFQPVVFFGGFAIATILALSPFGKRMAFGLPVAFLVGIHVYRLPLELILHQWWQEGFLPIQLTYLGDNFDIVTGVVAPIFAFLAWRFKNALWLTWIFNIGGLLLLLSIVTIVNLSTPTPLREALGGYTTGPVPDALHFPYFWLPSVAAAGAVFFHVVLFRRLLSSRGGRPDSARGQI